MHRKYFLGILILTLLCLLLILAYFTGLKPAIVQNMNGPENKSPTPHYINGVGIVEPSSGNISIGTPFNRIVRKVNVSVNDKVKKGDVLLELDNQDLKANLQIKQKEYEKAEANLQKLEEAPRKEDLTVATETLKKAQVALVEAKRQYEMVVNLPYPNAISKEQQDMRLSKYQQAQADLREREAQFEKIKSGTWQPDLKIAQQEVAQAQAELNAAETEIQRTYITAPIDGTVLQIKIHEGEISGPDPSKALMIIGNIDDLYLRVSIDQFDAPFVNSRQKAVAHRQGVRGEDFPLEFVLAEPLMVAKKYLTNSASEKVDTQVFEILYRIAKKDPFLIIGEQMDVYIERE